MEQVTLVQKGDGVIIGFVEVPSVDLTWSVFSGQKSGTKIILSILQSFLLFLKAKDIDICLK